MNLPTFLHSAMFVGSTNVGKTEYLLRILETKYTQKAEEHAKSRHFLINLSVQKFPKIVLEPLEHPKVGKHLIHNIYEHVLQNFSV